MIELRHVTFSVPTADGGRRPILDDVSLQIPDGIIACIMGTSGSGKTTLLRVVAGLAKPQEGQVLIDGRDIVGMRDRDMNEIRREMGFVFQYSALFDSLTVAENVGFGLTRQKMPRAEIQQMVQRLLEDVGLPGIEDRLPGDLSGGQRKRVAMARALATGPHLVLYDEPDSGLDPVMTRIIDDLILELREKQKTTNVVVSHNLDSIFRIADRILMVHAGRIVADGTPDQIRSSAEPAVRQFLEGRAHGPLVSV